MLSLILLFSTTLLVIAVIGLPPVIIKQPVDAEIFFKVSLSGNGHKPFEIECEAVGDPAPK
jgi:neuronal cell adhesion molecule